MKKVKTIGILASILSTISMIWGIGVVCYYVDDLRIRAISVALLITSNTFVSSFRGELSRNLKKSNVN